MFFLQPSSFAPGGPTDPYFANVVLLTTGDGANGSTTFPNLATSSPGPALTANGTCALSNAQSEYGTCSLATSGTTNNASTTESSSYEMSVPFTVEFSAYFTAASGSPLYMRLQQGPSGTNPTQLIVQGATFAPSGGNLWMDFGGCSTNAYVVSINAWHKFAYCRETSAQRWYIDGVRIDTIASGGAVIQPGVWFVGANSFGGAATIFFNNIRVTKGVARYTGASYTPDTGPFPTA